MTDSQIFAILGATNFAAVFLDDRTKLGPGRVRWSVQLARLTPAQRLDLESRLARHMARLQSEAPNASNFAKMPVQKRVDSGIR
jgi:hypothetical protein